MSTLEKNWRENLKHKVGAAHWRKVGGRKVEGKTEKTKNKAEKAEGKPR